MPDTYNHIAVEIDPTADIAPIFQDIKEFFNKNKNVTGLSIQVLPGADTDFWQALALELKALATLVELQQFALTTGSDSPQDFSNIVNMPFWQSLKILCINGSIESTCLQAIVDQFKSQPNLTSFTLNSTDLTAEEAKIIIRKAPSNLQSLDLSWNPIEASDTNVFIKFCQAIQASNLKALTLSSIGSAECTHLTSALADINRLFSLTLFVSPSFRDEDLIPLTRVMNLNPYIKINVDDCLGFMADTTNLTEFKKQYEKNKTPQLQHLVALKLSELLATNLIKPDTVAKLPDPCIDMLPMANASKAHLFELRNAMEETAKQESTLEVKIETITREVKKLMI